MFVLWHFQKCNQLLHLNLSFNQVDDFNELNHLMRLELLATVSFQGCPLIEKDGPIFYRARALRRLRQICVLDDDEVSSKEKVKALVMHGKEIESRKEVFHKHLLQEQFVNYL